MTHSSKLFILVVCFAVVFLFSGCQSAPSSEVTESSRGTAARAVVEASNEFKPHVIRAVPAKRPSWVDMVPRTDDFVYFVGASNDCSSESDARDRARENAAKQVASYLGTVIKNTAQGKKSIKSISDTELKMTVEQEELLQSFAERYVTQIQTDNYYTEQWQLTQKETGYRSWALCSISKTMAEDEINTFAGKISEQFIALLPENQPGKYSSVQSAVEAYISVFRDITANPIYQAVTFIETASGRAGLDEYVLLQAKRLVTECSISVESSPSKIGKGSVGTVVFKVVSPEYQSVGNLKYKAELTGAGISPVKGSGPVDADGRTPVAVSTSDLDFGSYTLAVHVVYDGSKNELGLVEGAVSVAQFEVTPVFFAVSFECAGDITEDEIPASTVITALQRGIQKYGIPMQISSSSDDAALWKFIFHVDSKNLSGGASSFRMSVESSVSLEKGGIIQATSASITGAGLSQNRSTAISTAIKECAGRLESDGTFFESIKKKLEGEGK